jgi:hypothetical protein
MPDSEDDDDNLVHFRPRTKSQMNGRTRQPVLRLDRVDIIASGAVIVGLVFAVAMVSQWLPIDAYTVGIVCCCGAGLVVAKLIKARRLRASGIRVRRNGR